MTGTAQHYMNCFYCDGDFVFTVENPDPSVGIMGYQVFPEDDTYETHAPDCAFRKMTGNEIDDVAYKISERLDDSFFQYDPY